MKWICLAFLLGVLVGCVLRSPRRRARIERRDYWAQWWRQWRLRRAARAALPDGTRVRLVCKDTGCTYRDHGGIWVTSWTPLRNGNPDDPDDYRLTREGDGEVTFATRGAIEPVGPGAQ